VAVYLLSDGRVAPVHRKVAASSGVARAALESLLEGPTTQDAADGLTSAVPSGTRLNGISVHGSVATVDLNGTFGSGGTSQSESARLAQVTYTVTQFPGISGVEFRMDGRTVTTFGSNGLTVDDPATRTSFEALTPAILVETPTAGDSVISPLHVSGSADVFEATFQLEVVDSSGQSLAAVTVHASSGTGTRGTFTATVPYGITAPEDGALVAYDLSPKDGSRQDVVNIPLHLGAE